MTGIATQTKKWFKRRLGVASLDFALERLTKLGFTPRLADKRWAR